MMSRYACYLFKNEKLIDNNCTAGYDEPLQTFFFQSGSKNKNGTPLIWLGTKYKEFETFSSLKLALAKRNYSYRKTKTSD